MSENKIPRGRKYASYTMSDREIVDELLSILHLLLEKRKYQVDDE